MNGHEGRKNLELSYFELIQKLMLFANFTTIQILIYTGGILFLFSTYRNSLTIPTYTMVPVHTVNENSDASFLGESGATSGASQITIGVARSTDTLIELTSAHCRVIDADGLICVGNVACRRRGHNQLFSSLARVLTGSYKRRNTKT
jgi:hypothetical protein